MHHFLKLRIVIPLSGYLEFNCFVLELLATRTDTGLQASNTTLDNRAVVMVKLEERDVFTGLANMRKPAPKQRP
jgi:hypothetical protein